MIGSSDLSALDADFCTTPPSPPHHGHFQYLSTPARYAFIGKAARCPSLEAPQFVALDGSLLPTPNGNLAADAMVSSMAHALHAVVTNPLGNGWFDRYGLENADKCKGTFGETYLTTKGARANMRLGQRDFLIQQNWVNGRRGYCGLSYP